MDKLVNGFSNFLLTEGVSSKKVLSFVEFIGEASVYEAQEGGYVPTKEQIQKILEIQEKIGENFKKNKPKIDFVEYLKSDKKEYRGRIMAYMSLNVFNSISDDSKKEEIIKAIQSLFGKKKIKQAEFESAIEKLEKISKNKEETQLSIYIGERKGTFKIVITEEEIESVTPAPIPDEEPKPNQVFDLIDDAKASYFFKNNMYDLEKIEETFLEPAYAKEVLESINAFIKSGFGMYSKGKEKQTGIESIVIRTSCSRYRNLGPAESMSWADLSYERASAFVKYILKTAKEVSSDDKDFVEQIMKTVFMDYVGSNGDGTSGPDPDKNKEGQSVKKGHYIKDGDKSKWVDKSKGSLVELEIVPIKQGDKNKPELGTSFQMKKAKDLDGNEISAAPAKPEDYDKFKYIFIELTGKPLDEDIPSEAFPGEVDDQVEKIAKYNAKVWFPSKSGKGGGGGEMSFRKIKRKEKDRKEHSKFGCAAYN